MCLTRSHQNSDVNIIKKQNQTKTRINKEKGTYRLLNKKCKFFDVYWLIFSKFCMQNAAKLKNAAKCKIDDCSYRLNFDLGKKNEIHHYS